jgi:uncharacterized protein GlcG (DUF336 family)
MDKALFTNSAHNAALRGGELEIPVNARSRAGRCALWGICAVSVWAASAAGQTRQTQPPAQGIVTQRNLSLGLAKTIAEAALAECQAKGFHTAVAVVDRAGQIMVILRDEQASAQSAEMARRKAYTAKMFRSTTLDFQKRTSDPTYAAQRDVADILALGGGVPIRVGDEIIGGVGSSGSSQEQDDACAKAGVAKAASLLK